MSGPMEERLDLSWRTEGVQVLVGLSGGADSVCLLRLLVDAGVTVVAAHLHHGQRAEADTEMERCAQFAGSFGVPFVSGRADVPKMSRELKVGLEEAGRMARYQFFEQARRQVGCALIATAHTLDDHVETVLMNLVRGCGIGGLAGIPARRESIVRPLLGARRSETRAYCEREGLWFHDDPANDEVAFTRVRLRKRVLPELEAINPQVFEAVARLASLADQDDRLLNGLAARMLEAAEVALNGPLRFLTMDAEAAFDQQRLMREPTPLVSRGMRLAAGALGAEFDYNQVSAILEGLAAEGGGSVTADGGTVEAVWDDETVHVRQKVAEDLYRHPLTIPGETENVADGWRFLAVPAEPSGPVKTAALEAILDAGPVDGRLEFGPSRPGDSIEPMGLGGSKKLSDVYREMGLTEAARRKLPVVYDQSGPVWVPGGPLCERFRVTDNTTRAIRISFGQPEATPERPGTKQGS